jgi:hypothetical protein
MESILWALDLAAVAYLCLWALKTEKRKDQAARDRKQSDA